MTFRSRYEILAGIGSLGAFATLATASRSAVAADAAKLSVATTGSDSSSTVFFAKELGYFTQNGLDVDITTTTNGADAVNATVSGSVDIASSNISSLVLAATRGIPVIAVAPGGVYNGSPTLALLVLKDSPIRTAADLNGKVVALPGLNTIAQFIIQAYMDKNGGNWRSVKFIELPLPSMPAALEQHRADCVTTFEPFITMGLDAGTLRIFANPNSSIASRWFTSLWISSTAFVQKNPDMIRRFDAAMRQAAVWANSHRSESAAILVKNSKLSPDLANRMARDDQGTILDPQLIQPVIDAMKKYGDLSTPLTAARLIWSPPR
jgi:NitT/TauT family transport system substrate-binding protein